MDEFITAENKKQNRQKPPLSVIRIACEILIGASTASALAFSALYMVGYADWREGGIVGLAALAIMSLIFPLLYVLGSTVGVYFVGIRGKQAGSFLLTLVGGFLGGLVILPMFFFANLYGNEFIGIEKIRLWAIVLLIPPIGATLCFNLTRRYKEQSKLKSTP